MISGFKLANHLKLFYYYRLKFLTIFWRVFALYFKNRWFWGVGAANRLFEAPHFFMSESQHQNLTSREWFIIINPNAGNQAAARIWPLVKSRLNDLKVKFNSKLTSRPGDGKRISQDVLRMGCRNLIIFGGDGTHHEVINGIMSYTPDDAQQISYAIFPCGTGNDFARHFNIPRDIEVWLHYINSAISLPIDIGQINAEKEDSFYFVNEAGIGLEYEVALRIAGTGGSSNGRARYLLETLKILLTYRGVMLKIHSEDQLYKGQFWNLTVANGRFLGGGFQLCPSANATDGKLAITGVRYVSPWRLIKDIFHFFNGKINQLPYVDIRESSRIIVEPHGHEVLLMEVDGEIRGSLPAEFTVLRNAINFFVPV
ncbi:MAG: diacylglycerol kinase family lipid kinase [Saprospiraceae bacterium]|nr:diacylglycerol kinase family lipid kinase [Saprospiraceae bacterium]